MSMETETKSALSLFAVAREYRKGEPLKQESRRLIWVVSVSFVGAIFALVRSESSAVKVLGSTADLLSQFSLSMIGILLAGLAIMTSALPGIAAYVVTRHVNKGEKFPIVIGLYMCAAEVMARFLQMLMFSLILKVILGWSGYIPNEKEGGIVANSIALTPFWLVCNVLTCISCILFIYVFVLLKGFLFNVYNFALFKIQVESDEFDSALKDREEKKARTAGEVPRTFPEQEPFSKELN